MNPYLKLVRPVNLLLIVAIQWVIKLGLFGAIGLQATLSPTLFFLLSLSTVLIAAGGNVINDIYDVEIDRVNRPDRPLVAGKISEKAANTFYVALTFLGVLFGFVVANSAGKPSLAAIFIVTAGLLYAYASHLKSLLIVGNVVVSFLIAMALLIIIILDIYPAIDIKATEAQLEASKIILQYSLFAFYINLIREIVKDCLDINGDKKGGIHTIPIAIGRKRTITIVFALGALGIVVLLIYMFKYLYQFPILNAYFLFGIIAPLLFFVIKAWSAKTVKEIAFLSSFLKIIMVSGLFSLLFYQFVY